MFTNYIRTNLTVIQRFTLLIMPGLIVLSTTLISCSNKSTQEREASPTAKTEIKTKVVHMGYQSSGDIYRIKGVLEQRLKPLGVSVKWAQFPAGPQLMEAMNVGKVDMGSVGETPPIFAQAAGTSLVYVAGRTPSEGKGSGLIVHQDSPIKSVADLKGQKVVFQKGSASHYLLLRALQEVGLKYSDVQAVSMAPAEARDAFIQKKIDAWVTWDPHLALVQSKVKARVLRDAGGIATQGGFYMASRKFVIENPELVRVIIEEIDKLGQWAEANPKEVAKILAPELKIDLAIEEIVTNRRTYRLRPITPELLEKQQEIAELFYQEKVIPKQIDIKEATLAPEQYAAITPTTLSQK